MKIMYHVALDWKEEQIIIMNRFGIYPKKGINAVQIEEKVYSQVKEYILKWVQGGGIRYPEFTKAELDESFLLAKKTPVSHGYPMPDMDFGYRDITYDLSDYCASCGVGLRQKDAFQIKSVPIP